VAKDAECPVAGVGVGTRVPVNAVVLGMVEAEGEAEGAAVDRGARIGIILILFLLVAVSVGCNRVMIPVDDAREFYDCYRAMEQGITFNRPEAKEIYNALRKTFKNWLKPFEENKGE